MNWRPRPTVPGLTNGLTRGLTRRLDSCASSQAGERRRTRPSQANVVLVDEALDREDGPSPFNPSQNSAKPLLAREQDVVSNGPRRRRWNDTAMSQGKPI